MKRKAYLEEAEILRLNEWEEKSEKYMLSFTCEKCALDQHPVNYFDEDSVVANLAEDENFSFAVMRTYIVMLRHEYLHEPQGILLLQYWTVDVDVNDLPETSQPVEKVITVVSDIKHYGVICVEKDHAIIYDGVNDSLMVEYIRCVEAVLGKYFSTIDPTKLHYKMERDKVTEGMSVDPGRTPYPITEGFGTRQPDDNRCCGAVACLMIRNLVDESYQLPTDFYRVVREDVMRHVKKLLWNGKQYLFHLSEAVMNSERKDHFESNTSFPSPNIDGKTGTSTSPPKTNTNESDGDMELKLDPMGVNSSILDGFFEDHTKGLISSSEDGNPVGTAASTSNKETKSTSPPKTNTKDANTDLISDQIVINAGPQPKTNTKVSDNEVKGTKDINHVSFSGNVEELGSPKGTKVDEVGPVSDDDSVVVVEVVTTEEVVSPNLSVGEGTNVEGKGDGEKKSDGIESEDAAPGGDDTDVVSTTTEEDLSVDSTKRQPQLPPPPSQHVAKQ